MPTKLRVAYTNPEDIRNVRTWSGTPYHLALALERSGIDLQVVSPLETISTPYGREKKARYGMIGQKFHLDSQAMALRGYARQIEAALSGARVDVVLATNPVPIAALEVPQPIITWADATYALLHDWYPTYSGVCAESIEAGCRVERLAGQRAFQVFSSEWAARSAILHFGAHPDRVRAVNYGTNLEHPPTADDVRGFIAHRARGEVKLLWIGVRWGRKGGDIALEALDALLARGLNATLTMIGCEVSPEAQRHPRVTALGFVSKQDRAGRATIDRLLAESHFLIVPTRADCTPMVIGEASAFGLPSVLPDVGGVSSVLRDGRNGLLLPAGASGEAYADRIEACLSVQGLYETLCRSSREEFEERLNWDASIRRFKNLLFNLAESRTALPQAA